MNHVNNFLTSKFYRVPGLNIVGQKNCIREGKSINPLIKRKNGSLHTNLLAEFITLPFHFIEINGPATIHIIHPESPGQFFFWRPTRGHMQRKHELPKVNGSALVYVKSPKDILAELVGIPTWKHLVVHPHELFFCQLSAGTVLEETFVPFLKEY